MVLVPVFAGDSVNTFENIFNTFEQLDFSPFCFGGRWFSLGGWLCRGFGFWFFVIF